MGKPAISQRIIDEVLEGGVVCNIGQVDDAAAKAGTQQKAGTALKVAAMYGGTTVALVIAENPNDHRKHQAISLPRDNALKNAAPNVALIQKIVTAYNAHEDMLAALKRPITSKEIEAAARVIDPNCFWDEEAPNLHQVRKKERALKKAAGALHAAAIAKKGGAS